MSALTARRAPITGTPVAADTDSRSRVPRSALVGPAAGRLPAGRAVHAGDAFEPRSSSIAPGHGLGAAGHGVAVGTVIARRDIRSSRTPVRLTRRGRAVVACFLVASVTIGVLLISLLAAGRAQATNRGQARAGYQGMHQIVVRPGQTLWSIASAAEPWADTRVVVQEIITANSLNGVTISADQLLWVPR